MTVRVQPINPKAAREKVEAEATALLWINEVPDEKVRDRLREAWREDQRSRVLRDLLSCKVNGAAPADNLLALAAAMKGFGRDVSLLGAVALRLNEADFLVVAPHWPPGAGVEGADLPGIWASAERGEKPKESPDPAPAAVGKSVTALVAIKSTDLLNMKLAEREMYLSPIIAAQSIAMVYAKRGAGKTYFLLSTALTIVKGGSYLGFAAPTPRKVLYIEGELPLRMLQDRMRQLGTHDNLTIINPELQPDMFLPHLGHEDAQNLFEPLVAAHDVIILDSLATLAPSTYDTDATVWSQLQPWFLAQRRHRKGMVFAHHTNARGTQRGVTNREDVLDFVIKLEHIGEPGPCHFGLTFEKTRQFDSSIDPTKAFAMIEAELVDGVWRYDHGQPELLTLIVDLHRAKNSIGKIAAELKVSKSTVHKYVAIAIDKGLLL